MDNSSSARRKLAEWVRRYLPCEIAGTVGELGGAGLLFVLTESFAAAAVGGTIGASVGFYAIAFGNAVRMSYAIQTHRRWPVRFAAANGLALRSVAIEFGPAELVDSLAVRPLAYYLGPVLVDTAMLGWIGAKVFSDLAFYACAVFSYERFNRLLALRGEHGEKVDDEPVTTARAA
ncbi:MAG TPA: hypothetical protein VIJ23_10960 [Mycobacterium sp.]|jgi:hypothetical protein